MLILVASLAAPQIFMWRRFPLEYQLDRAVREKLLCQASAKHEPQKRRVSCIADCKTVPETAGEWTVSPPTRLIDDTQRFKVSLHFHKGHSGTLLLAPAMGADCKHFQRSVFKPKQDTKMVTDEVLLLYVL